MNRYSKYGITVCSMVCESMGMRSIPVLTACAQWQHDSQYTLLYMLTNNLQLSHNEPFTLLFSVAGHSLRQCICDPIQDSFRYIVVVADSDKWLLFMGASFSVRV